MAIRIAEEDYIKLIYKLGRGDGKVTLKRVADGLQISAPAVTKMVKKLQHKGLVTFDRATGVALTTAGRQVALQVVRSHRLIEVFLHDYLGYSWDEVHEEAETLEHVVSDRFKERLAARLNHPTHDPHGDPIPDDKLQFKSREEISLLEADEARSFSISRVSDDDPEDLKELAQHGLFPGVDLKRVENGDSNQVVLTLVSGERIELSRRLSNQIRVTETDIQS